MRSSDWIQTCALRSVSRRKRQMQSRSGARRARPSFIARHESLRRELNAMRTALYRSTAARHRLEAMKARTDMSEWQTTRREPTRQPIQLGRLVVKADLVERTGRAPPLPSGRFPLLAHQPKNPESP